MSDPMIIFLVLATTIGLFIWGQWRYDLVACFALFSLIITGVLPADKAFSGFSNPAVVTVACVMILTRAITATGLIDNIVHYAIKYTEEPVSHVLSLCVVTAILSAFMNNVGALALMMPIAIHTAKEQKRSVSMLLMPLAFASVLGGMTTAIGTPPNLLIAAYREQVTGHPFIMFDFTPVGIVVASVTIAFIAYFGWRLLPTDRKTPSNPEDLFQMNDYIFEILVPEGSHWVNETFASFTKLNPAEFTIIGLIRGKKRKMVIAEDELLQEKDILIVEGGHDELKKILRKGELELFGGEVITPEILSGKNVSIIEAVVPQGARVEGRSWQRMRLRSRYHVNLIAISREGRAFKTRLNHVNFHAGDVVLIQGDSETLQETVLNLGFLPLVERDVEVGIQRKAFIPLIVFGISILLAAYQVLPIAVAFAMAIFVLVFMQFISIQKIYKYIDWSIVVLLAAMIPIGGALQASGGTDMIAKFFVMLATGVHPFFIFALLLVITMSLSDVMNNAATAVVMAPIAVSIAQGLHVSADPFLMTVAIGASCSFLTPISHQNNTLVLGPGGYQFFDYVRLGLPVEILVLIVSLPMIMFVWPL